MKMYIPSLGDEIKLTKDWSFTLYYERRNRGVFKRLNIDPYLMFDRDFEYTGTYFAVTWVIPADTILKINRVFIRQGSEEFNSVTFSGKETGRFWAKLEDVNTIEFTMCQ